MKQKVPWCIVLLLAGAISPGRSQTIKPFTLNSGGGWGIVNGNIFEYSIGEMVAISTLTGSNVIVTQGLLQPLPITTILPVTLIRFQGAKMRDFNKLDWTTGFESGQTRFELQRSDDASNFATIITIPAHGLTNGSTYSYNDYKPFQKQVYYRLKIIEEGGSIRYSSIVVIYGFENTSWSIFPNPAKAGDRLKINVQNSNDLKAVTLVLTDAAGRIIHSRQQSLAGGFQTISITAPMIAGTYLLNLIGITNSQYQKIIIR